MSHRSPIRTALVAATAVLLLGAAGCSKSNTDVRAEVKSTLVKGGMSEKQASCLVDKLSDTVINEIRDGKTPKAGSPELQAYAKSVQSCATVK